MGSGFSGRRLRRIFWLELLNGTSRRRSRTLQWVMGKGKALPHALRGDQPFSTIQIPPVTLFRMTVAEDDDKDLSWVFYNAQRSEEIVSKTEVRGSISEVGYNNACDRLNQERRIVLLKRREELDHIEREIQEWQTKAEQLDDQVQQEEQAIKQMMSLATCVMKLPGRSSLDVYSLLLTAAKAFCSPESSTADEIFDDRNQLEIENNSECVCVDDAGPREERLQPSTGQTPQRQQRS